MLRRQRLPPARSPLRRSGSGWTHPAWCGARAVTKGTVPHANLSTSLRAFVRAALSDGSRVSPRCLSPTGRVALESVCQAAKKEVEAGSEAGESTAQPGEAEVSVGPARAFGAPWLVPR